MVEPHDFPTGALDRELGRFVFGFHSRGPVNALFAGITSCRAARHTHCAGRADEWVGADRAEVEAVLLSGGSSWHRRRVLAHTEDVGLACSEAPALSLHDVKILPGRVRCGMSHHEVVCRDLANVVQRQS